MRNAAIKLFYGRGDDDVEGYVSKRC